MAKNKIITSQGNVQFTNSKGRTIDMHPMHCYAVYENDTVSFLFIYMKEYSGQAFFSSQYEDLEVNGESFDSLESMKEAITDAFAHAGAQARAEIVDELPENPLTNTIYLVKKEKGEGYDEYIYIEGKGWELIGDTSIEFDEYVEKTEFNQYKTEADSKFNNISGAVDTNASDIQSLSGAVDTAVSDLEASDAAISGAVDTLSTSLNSEAQRAQNAEQTLQNNINTVNSRVDAEQIARATADNTLKDEFRDYLDDFYYQSGEIDNLLEGKAWVGVEALYPKAFTQAEYDSETSTIIFKSILDEEVASIDASDFIKDGMIEDVRIENGYLVIDFNTDSGQQDIRIPLTDLFDPTNYYDKTEVDDLLDEKLDASAYTPTDLSNYYNKTEVNGLLDDKADVSALTATNSRIDTVSGDVATKADAADVYTKSEVDTKIAEIDLSDYYDKTEVDGLLDDKLDASAYTPTDLSNYYTKSQVYTKAETKSAISAATSGKADSSSVYTYVAADNRITVATTTGNNRKAIGLGVPVYKGSGTQSLAFLVEQGTGQGANNIQGVFSAGIGWGLSTKNQGEVAVGQFNKSVSATTTFGDSGNTLFSVGNGEYQNQEKNAFEVRQNGDIYIIDTNDTSHTTWYKPMIKLQDHIGGSSITVDSALDSGSTNPVENRVIYNKIDEVEQVAAAALINLDEKKLDASAYTPTDLSNYYTKTETNGLLDDKADLSALTEDERVWGAALNDINSRINTVSGDVATKQDALTAGSGISIVNNVISVTGGGSITIDTALNSGSTNPVENRVIYNKIDEVEQVTAAGLNVLNDNFGGLKLVKLSQAEYSALAVKDSNTLYIIVG